MISENLDQFGTTVMEASMTRKEVEVLEQLQSIQLFLTETFGNKFTEFQSKRKAKDGVNDSVSGGGGVDESQAQGAHDVVALNPPGIASQEPSMPIVTSARSLSHNKGLPLSGPTTCGISISDVQISQNPPVLSLEPRSQSYTVLPAKPRPEDQKLRLKRLNVGPSAASEVHPPTPICAPRSTSDLVESGISFKIPNVNSQLVPSNVDAENGIPYKRVRRNPSTRKKSLGSEETRSHSSVRPSTSAPEINRWKKFTDSQSERKGENRLNPKLRVVGGAKRTNHSGRPCVDTVSGGSGVDESHTRISNTALDQLGIASQEPSTSIGIPTTSLSNDKALSFSQPTRRIGSSGVRKSPNPPDTSLERHNEVTDIAEAVPLDLRTNTLKERHAIQWNDPKSTSTLRNGSSDPNCLYHFTKSTTRTLRHQQNAILQSETRIEQIEKNVSTVADAREAFLSEDDDDEMTSIDDSNSQSQSDESLYDPSSSSSSAEGESGTELEPPLPMSLSNSTVACRTSSRVRRNVLSSQLGIKRNTCIQCGEAFYQPEELHHHMAKHTGNSEQPFKCDLCHKFFTDMGSLRQHLKFTHPDKKPYGCPVPHCTVRVDMPSKIKRHLLSHSNIRKYKCPDCGAAYKYYNQTLMDHMLKCSTRWRSRQAVARLRDFE